MKKIFALLLAAMMLFGVAALAEDEAGFEEFPIGEEQDVGPDEIIHIAAVYFQPVVMEPASEAGLTVEEANIHIEADISANENNLGYGAGDWIPYLTIDYKVVDGDGNVMSEGTFMPMAASDGPHYGANIKLDVDGVYSLVLTIHSPAENGYLLHVDPETGVEGRFWSEPIEVTFEGWEYFVQEW
ncbi:MAG: iron transporter [Clostridia bacterium]|nr:iron transporter [Clostridia bacterium]MBR0464944.1 iron transporter [Clostridia bacterium]